MKRSGCFSNRGDKEIRCRKDVSKSQSSIMPHITLIYWKVLKSHNNSNYDVSASSTGDKRTELDDEE